MGEGGLALWAAAQIKAAAAEHAAARVCSRPAGDQQGV